MADLTAARERAIQRLKTAVQELLDASDMIAGGLSTDRAHYARYDNAERAVRRAMMALTSASAPTAGDRP